MLVRPNSLNSNSSIKKNEPAGYLSFTLFNQRGMSFIKAEFKPWVTEFSWSLKPEDWSQKTEARRLKPKLWVWLMFLTIFFLVIQLELNANKQAETVHNLRHCNHENKGFKFNISYIRVANKIGRRSSKWTLQTRDRLSGRILGDRNIWSWL